MLDLKHLRENWDAVAKSLGTRGGSFHLERLKMVDGQRRDLLGEVEQLKGKRNKASQEIGRLQKNKEDASLLIEEMKEVSSRIKDLDSTLSEIEEDLHGQLLTLPNIPHSDVPVGQSEEDNEEVKVWSQKPDFDFTPKPHWEVGESLGILDFERGAKITGARFTLYRGGGARLERALINFMLDLHTSEHGYEEVLPPFIVNSDSMTGTGQLPKFGEDLFKLEGLDYYLIPTAEVPVTNIFRDEILKAGELPVKLTAYTPCFRREAGSWGKEVRGLNRLHQFDKVEIVQIQHPERSYASLEEMSSHIEGLIRKLELPYRILRLCGGDISFTSALTYDFEVFAAAQQKWLEVSSVSNFESYQSNRLKLRFREQGDKKARLAHTLNGSALALPRILAALIENNQSPEGIRIPPALQPYTGFEMIQ